MSIIIDQEIEKTFPFDIQKTIEDVVNTALIQEQCPYDVSINVLITDLEGIRFYNREYRDIDRETDVLSFPAVDYDAPADFSIAESSSTAYFDPDTDELMLGDIILCYDRVFMQAKEYGHSSLREFAFLIAHSVLHLLGYDHMEPEEEHVMFDKQEQILQTLGITREK